jgi:hypothetical protein
VSKIDRMADRARAGNADADQRAFDEHRERIIGETRDFNSTAQCPKCNKPRADASVIYCPGFIATLPAEGQGCKRAGEHLHVSCPCNFFVLEHCADRQVVHVEEP